MMVFKLNKKYWHAIIQELFRISILEKTVNTATKQYFILHLSSIT